MKGRVLVILLAAGCHGTPHTAEPSPSPPSVAEPMTVKPGAPLRLVEQGPLKDGAQVIHVLVEEPVDALNIIVRDDVTLLTEIRLDALPAGYEVKVPLTIDVGPRRLISISARAWHQGKPQDRVMAVWTRTKPGEKVEPQRPTTTDPLGRRIISLPTSR